MWSYETDRLTVRHLSGRFDRTTLAAEFTALLSPLVLRPLPMSLQLGSGPDAVISWIDARMTESDLCLVRTRVDGALIGALLSVQPDQDGPIHLGYLFGEAAWGRGYGSEMLRGLVAQSKGQHLRAGVARDNPASARVLEKAGFHLDQTDATAQTLTYRHPQ